MWKEKLHGTIISLDEIIMYEYQSSKTSSAVHRVLHGNSLHVCLYQNVFGIPLVSWLEILWMGYCPPSNEPTNSTPGPCCSKVGLHYSTDKSLFSG